MTKISGGFDNRQTPRYYGEFREAVLAGRIPVCREISLEMNRIDRWIDNPDYFYNPKLVEGFISFCESEMTKTDGSPIKLLPTFKLWAEQLLGWYYISTKKVWVSTETGGYFEEVPYLKRLINKQYLIVARGGAKSLYASFIQAYFLLLSGKTTQQITTSPTMKQAEEVITPIVTAMTVARGVLMKFMTSEVKKLGLPTGNHRTMLASTKKGIQNFLTNSILEIRPMSIAKLQGLRPFVSTVDEWLSGDIREDVIGALEQGASKLPDYIIVAVSSEGTVRNGAGDDIKLELTKILNGEYQDDHTSIWHYKLDDISEVADPSLWEKAQPNLGVTVSYEAYEKDVARAEANPASRNDIISKRFNIPLEGFTYFFTYLETIAHRPSTYNHMECALGADLSQGDDFCSFTFLFPLSGGRFGVKSLSFISERTLKLLKPVARSKYDIFIDEGSLVVLDGSILDMVIVFQEVDEYIRNHNYTVRTMGYDPYNADAFVKAYSTQYGSFGVEIVRQGSKTESVPLGEIKKLANDRKLLFDEAIFSFAMGNAMVIEDTNGNRKLWKARYENKIDPVSALVDAFVAYQRNQAWFF